MIYLDHAATSFPKPPEVLAAVGHWFREIGVSPARGDSDACRDAARVTEATRTRLARLCGVPSRRLAFTSGATASLNIFLDGFLREGDAVLTTALEHSSLVRPLVHLRAQRGVTLEVLVPGPDGTVPAEAFAAALARRRFRLVAFSHASNVLGSVLDAAAICSASRRHGATTLLDASATAGRLPLDVGADAVVASAHKGLLGPPGLGFLAVREPVSVAITRSGGTGSSAALDAQPSEWPEAMEPGTPNTPAVFGLAAGLDWLERQGPAQLLERELALLGGLTADLAGSAVLHGPPADQRPRLPILSFTVPGLDPAEAGMILAGAGIHVRTGFHCAPWLHDHTGTAAAGTVRVSIGPFNSEDDIRAVSTALFGARI